MSECRGPGPAFRVCLSPEITYKPFYKHLAKHPAALERLLVSVVKALLLLSQERIVHSDLKTENILVRTKGNELLETKLIDYGSSF